MTKKVLFYIPVIVFALFYGFIAIAAIGTISSIVIGWLILFAIAGVLLSKAVFWGGLLGILPAIHLIYMSTQKTGQIIDIELPVGIILFVYYAICCYCVYKNTKTKVLT